MRAPGRRLIGAAGVAAVAVLALTGCFGPDPSIAIDRAGDDFGALVEVASAVDVDVLHTLEVEPPVSESCDTESESVHTAYVAAGTVAVAATQAQERDLLTEFALDPERWQRIDSATGSTRRAYVDEDGITSTVTVENGLLVIAVFSPCRG